MHTTVAGLEVEVLQRTAGAPTGLVILCHGFGAPGSDLVPLHEALVDRAPELASVRFAFPAAPIELQGWGDARAWWLIDVEAVARLGADPERLREFRRVEPDGLPAARTALRSCVDALVAGSHLDWNQVVLGGFSQGAMITTDLALRAEERCAGLAVLSGTLLTEPVWKEKASRRAGLPVFQAHGRADPILPFGAAESLRDLLKDAGAQVEFHAFNGGHTITAAELDSLAAFLVRTLKKA